MLHIKKIKPLFTNLVTTGEKFSEDQYTDGGIISECKKGDLKTWQRVIAVGDSIRNIKVGDMVMINVDNYAVRRYDANSIQNDLDNNPKLRYLFNWVTIDDENGNPMDCLFLNDRDILFTFEGEETKPKVKVPNKKIIV